MYFNLLGTNAFHIKAKNERLTTAGSRCGQNLKFYNFTSSFGRLCQNIAPKACRTCSTIIFSYSTNQIIDLLCCRSVLFPITTETAGKTATIVHVSDLLSLCILHALLVPRLLPSFLHVRLSFCPCATHSHVRFCRSASIECLTH